MQTLLIDGNNMAYRSNSVTELTTKDGRRTSAIFGVLNSIFHEIHNVSDELDIEVGEIVVAWDFGRNKRRLTLFPEYKRNRKHDDTEEDRTWYEEFIQQTEVLHNMLPLLGVKSLKLSGQEADDLVYTWIHLAEQLRDDEDNYFVIVSTDEDFLQLVSDNVSVWSPIKKIMYAYENFKDLVGIAPEQFISYKVLKGDSSDNISGIAGIGEVIGKKLVNQYGNLSSILANAKNPELRKSKVSSRIFTPEGLEILDRNNKLINLADYVDVEETRKDVEALIQQQPSVSDGEVKAFLMEYQLSSILMKFKEWIRVFKSVNNTYFE